MIDPRPVITRLRHKVLGASRSFFDLADEGVDVAPSDIAYSPPVIELPDERERILALAEGVNRDFFDDRMRGGERRHPPTRAYRFAQAILADGTVYASGALDVLSPVRKRAILIGSGEALSDRLLATNSVCEQYFGHWLTDGLALELLAAERHLPALGIARVSWDQEPDYREMVGMKLARTQYARIRNLWVVDDRSMNAGRVARMAELRRRIRANAVPTGKRACFLMRTSGVARNLTNQQELAAELSRRGFDVIDPVCERAHDLATRLSNASIVVSVEGSALCHAVMAMADRGVILAIQPPQRVNWIQQSWCDCAGLRFAQTIADQVAEGFYLPPDRLLRAIDHAVAVADL